MPSVLYEPSGAIATITLNRPDKMNAYNYALHSELLDAIKRGDADNNIRVMVITGAGKAFCAGADLDLGFSEGDFVNEDDVVDGISRDIGGILNIATFASDTPIIAAINGHAIGIGATMLLPMDIKIASRKSKFAFPFGRRGIVYDGAASFFLPRVVGMAKAQEWILKGDIILADEALSAGLVSEVVEPDQVLTRAMALAKDIAENISPESAARNKQLLRASIYGDSRYDTPAMSAHMLESQFLNEAFSGPDCLEGVKSFMEKRPPKFKNRG